MTDKSVNNMELSIHLGLRRGIDLAARQRPATTLFYGSIDFGHES